MCNHCDTEELPFEISVHRHHETIHRRGGAGLTILCPTCTAAYPRWEVAVVSENGLAIVTAAAASTFAALGIVDASLTCIDCKCDLIGIRITPRHDVSLN